MKNKLPNQVDCKENLQKIQQKLSCFEDDVLPHLPSKEFVLARAKQRQHDRLKKKRVTVSLLSVLLLGISIYAYNPCYHQIQAQTPTGLRNVLVLQDGSKIYLNVATHIRVLQRLRSQEIILEQGEARFEVAHLQPKILRPFERRFEVHAGALQIVDIGTVFNVFKHNETDATVTVVQGEVAVNTIDNRAKPQHLQQGQSMRNWQQQLSSLIQVNTDNLKDWPTGMLYFDQTPLSEAISHFQRYHDFKVKFSEQEIQKLQVTGQFKPAHYAQFIQILPMLGEVKVKEIAKDNWYVQKK